ncbi:hypothetical protein JTB14_009409 [Gonioctena quinquepunctata]|nr:hypothetical protein JTB14_009409 [Gonioctena quinquepunctata]
MKILFLFGFIFVSIACVPCRNAPHSTDNNELEDLHGHRVKRYCVPTWCEDGSMCTCITDDYCYCPWGNKI